MDINEFREERFKFGLSPEERKSFYERKTLTAANFFETFSFPTLLYAIGFTLCFYKAHIGIIIPVLMIITGIYINVVIKKLERKLSIFSYICIGIAFLIGLSICLTANTAVIFIDYWIIYLLFMAVLMDSFFDISKWSLGLTIKNLFRVIFASLSYLDRPFSDIKCAKKIRANEGRKTSDKVKYAFIGFAISIPVFIVLGVILSSADDVFREFIGHFFEELFESADIFLVPLMAVLAYMFVYFVLRYICSGDIKDEETVKNGYNEVIGIAFMVSILLLYLSFCFIQIRYLFFSDADLPEGVTYSSYARNGFFQLLFVSVINVIMVLLIKELFNNSRVLDIMLVICCCMTYIIIASAALRMRLYIDAYYLTFDRILVLVTLAIIGIVLVGIILFILNDSFPIYKYCVISISVCIMIFSFARVDGCIAKYDIDKWTEQEEDSEDKESYVDYEYLGQLSLDAAPYIMNYLEDRAREEKLRHDMHESDDAYEVSYYEFNEYGGSYIIRDIIRQSEINDTEYQKNVFSDNDDVSVYSSEGELFRSFTRYDNYDYLQNKNLRNFNFSVSRARKAIDNLVEEMKDLKEEGK